MRSRPTSFLTILNFFFTLSNFKIILSQVTDAPAEPNVDPNITDAVAIQASTIPWYLLDPYQQDHIRFHCYISMATYGDLPNLCPSTFTVGTNDFEVLETFSTNVGQSGYTSTKALSWAPVPIDFGHPTLNCNSSCTTGQGILDLYNSARIATNDWQIAKEAVNRTGHKFSVTGHAIGGSVAQPAALDLGSQGWVHYAHSQAAPRSLSPTASKVLSAIFQGECSQHVIANNDLFPHVFPVSADWSRPDTSVYIFGNQTQYLYNCPYYSENKACLGHGTSFADHFYYFTPMGTCGAANNTTSIKYFSQGKNDYIQCIIQSKMPI